MLKRHRIEVPRQRLAGGLLLAISMAFLAWGHASSARAVDTSGFDMSLNITGCAEGTVTTRAAPAKCTLAVGSTFSVSYDLDSIPFLPDTDSDGINGYSAISMVSAFSGVQYKPGTFIPLHGVDGGTQEPPLGPLDPNGIFGIIYFPTPCTPPDVADPVCESDAKHLTAWTAEFNCAASGSIEILPRAGGLVTIIGQPMASLPAVRSIAINCMTPVGGIAVDPDLSTLQIEPSDSAGVRVGLLVAIAVGGAAAVGAAGWYAWRRATS